MTTIKSNLCKQFEFWFSDSNLPYDRFLMKYINGENWIPINVFLKFNTVKQQKISDCATLIKAIKESELLELNKDNSSVRRKAPMPTEEQLAQRLDRLIYFKFKNDKKLTPEEISILKSEFAKFGDILFFKVFIRQKTKHNCQINGAVEFSDQNIATKTASKKSLSIPASGEAANFDLTLYCAGNLIRQEKQKQAEEMLNGFSKSKIFKINGLNNEVTFFDIQNFLAKLIWNSKSDFSNIEKVETKPKINKISDKSGEIENESNNKMKPFLTEKNLAQAGIKTTLAESLLKSRKVFRGDILEAKSDDQNSKLENKVKKYFALVRISSESDLTAKTVSTLFERYINSASKDFPKWVSFVTVECFDCEEEAKKSWIRSVEEMRRVCGQKKGKKKRKRKNFEGRNKR